MLKMMRQECAFIHGSKLENLHRTDSSFPKSREYLLRQSYKVQPFNRIYQLGEARHGFLSLSDINFQVYKPNRQGRGKPSISQFKTRSENSSSGGR